MRPYWQREAISREVAPGLHAIKSLYAANKPLWLYLLDGDYALWVDVGINVTPKETAIPYLSQNAPAAWGKSQMVIITHADVDHFGGLRGLKGRRPDAVVMAHAADRRWIESAPAVLDERYRMHRADGIDLPAARQDSLNERGGGGGKVDIALNGEETIYTGRTGTWQVLHTPGHSDGHLVLWDEDRRWAIIGDAVLDWGVPNVDGELIAPPPYYDKDKYLATIDRLAALKPELVFTSHYGILDRAASEQMFAHSRAAVEAVETGLANSLQGDERGLTLLELCAAVGARCAQWPEALWPGLADPLSAHLKRHLADGTVERDVREGIARYRWLGR